jgi:deazaflavin-dependent oxidoreductase (nitroreductase family)
MLRWVSVQVPPSGTRGGKFQRLPGPLTQFMNDTIFRIFRNRKFNGGSVLSLTTVGARSGQQRRSTLMYFPDGHNAWLIVGSAGGAATHPAWIYNLAKNPDQVWIEIGSKKLKVACQSLVGDARGTAWQRITSQAPNFAGYESKTDREIPVVRLTPA